MTWVGSPATSNAMRPQWQLPLWVMESILSGRAMMSVRAAIAQIANTINAWM
jgi:hypothetical protein